MSFREKSQKQLQVAEAVKRELAQIFLREDIFRSGEINLTVCEADMSPDLKNSKVFVNIFGAVNKAKIIKELNDNSWFFQHKLVKALKLKNAPKIVFILDESLAKGQAIENAIKKDSKNFDREV